MLPALLLGSACAEQATVFPLTGERFVDHPGLLLAVEAPGAVVEVRVLDPEALPAIITLPEDAVAARLIAFDVTTGELFEEEEGQLAHAPDGEPIPPGAFEVQLEFDEADPIWRERARSTVLAAYRVRVRKRCRVFEPDPPIPLPTEGRVVTITRTPDTFGSIDILAFTEDGMSLSLREDGTVSAPVRVPRPLSTGPVRLVWVESSGQKLHHFFDDGLITVQSSTGTRNLWTPDRRIVAGDARLQVSGIEIGVLTADEELGLYVERDQAWTFIPTPGVLSSTTTARLHMSRGSARVGLLSADGGAWNLVERSRPVVSIAPPGSGPPVYLRELEPSFRFHYMTSAGEVYRETPTGFELVRSIDLGAPVAAAELGADLGRDLLAVSALGRLHEIRDGTVCPPVPLDVRPDGGFEGFREAVFVTGTDLSSGERVIQRVRSSEP